MEDKRGLVGYVDADGASQLHRRAISGYVFMVDGGAVSWSSKKQELVTLSTAEAEYVPHTCCQGTLSAGRARVGPDISWPTHLTWPDLARPCLRV